MSSHDSYDSLVSETTLVNPPVNAQEAARNNITKEMVETERKYVQDLEIMQVRPPDCGASPPHR
jgi:cell division control protein 24